ncbi:MAG: MBL fold metallo-hydrolase [Candidatus Tokpelaia sp. JSC188]|nr:MAG: MBL fold metallo-hydrolase [Candidatus Tokpelaia sp. JSC188]
MFVSNDDEFVFLPLGGVGEIGMNLAVYGYGASNDREWLLVDMGVSFATSDLFGADLVLPDIRFLRNERHNIHALILTHAHEDHYGAVLDLWPQLKIPVYCTAFTAGLLEIKRKMDFDLYKIPLNIFKAGDRLQIGSFEIEAIAVNHSIPDPVSLAIRTPLGVVLHTGDWKIDKAPTQGALTDEKRFRQIGAEGILALICDSTNAMIDKKSLSEQEISQNLQKIIAKTSGRVAVTTFASNIGRIKSIALAAEKEERRVMLVGRSMKRSVAIAEELGYMEGITPFLSEEDYDSTPRDKIVLILTGSQGELRAALAKIARDEMRDITLTAGDVVIYSSRSIPGNERAIIDIQNRLIDRGIKVITDHDTPVHVSGHPYREQLKEMYTWIKPQILVPVHGDAIHLEAHASLGEISGIKTVMRIRNGHVLRLSPGKVEVIDQVPVGRIYKDGNLLGNENELGIRTRRRLCFMGHVAVSLLLDKSYELATRAQVVALGLPKTNDQGLFLEDILLDSIKYAFNGIPKKRRKDTGIVREAAHKAVHSAVNKIWGKKTIVTVFLHRA